MFSIRVFLIHSVLLALIASSRVSKLKAAMAAGLISSSQHSEALLVKPNPYIPLGKNKNVYSNREIWLDQLKEHQEYRLPLWQEDGGDFIKPELTAQEEVDFKGRKDLCYEVGCCSGYCRNSKYYVDWNGDFKKVKL